MPRPVLWVPRSASNQELPKRRGAGLICPQPASPVPVPALRQTFSSTDLLLRRGAYPLRRAGERE